MVVIKIRLKKNLQQKNSIKNKWSIKNEKMSGKENDTAAIFKTVVEIYESDYQLYRSSRSNKLKICSEVVSRSVSLQNSKNVSKTNSKKTEVGFQIDS